ncbi:PrgI family protein [Nostocoides sp. F2B08]|uniref:SCO6880 family protein n=1 Tax=Nostocoides sp. F2B08 TaxID=2653936 RepID=UPI001263C0BF|nr:SCO6880 family protein [Tetrasphaera sp. F2B08]KAB7740042.1 PrgI family protein [Tetrasphaera sp. F2B08]
MAQIYSQYSKARIGWFLGLTGWQAAIVAAATLPFFWALKEQAWASAGMFLLIAAGVITVTVVPVRGRSAIGWLLAVTGFAVGGLTGWTRYRSRASRGAITDVDEVDLPGVLAGIEIHEGPPTGLSGARVAVIQNHAARTWAATAAIVHSGTGMADTHDRARMGQGLAELLDQASRSDLVDEILFLVRTVPDDGAERDQWVTRHRHPGSPLEVRTVNDQLQQALTSASVRTEAYVTVVVPEARLGKVAREAGRGIDARAAVLYGVLAEVEAQLKGGLGMTSVAWLTSPELAAACRTGFAPGDRAGIIDALTAHAADDTVNAAVPWSMAGPSGADPAARHYSHDAWNSISATITLPIRGAVLGALAPVLTPTQPGERRSYLVAYPILTQTSAARQSASSEWAADMGQGLREKAKMRTSTRSRDENDQVRALEAKLARGSAVTRPYAVCTVTVPKTARIAEHARHLDASIRRAGFAPLRLDLAQDVAFAASVVPLGISLTRTTT